MDKLGNITLYNADCMEIMKGFADKQFDICIVDKINMILLLLQTFVAEILLMTVHQVDQDSCVQRILPMQGSMM